MDKRVKSLWRKITKLERQIEDTAIEEARDGYELNQFGEYDRSDLTTEWLDAYEELLRLTPDDLDVRYSFGAALLRGRRFERTREVCQPLLESSSNDRVMGGRLMLALLEVVRGDDSAAAKHLGVYNELCDAAQMPFMRKTMEQLKGTPRA